MGGGNGCQACRVMVHWAVCALGLGVEAPGEKLHGGSIAMGLAGGFGALAFLLSPPPPATATWAGMAGAGAAAASA